MSKIIHFIVENAGLLTPVGLSVAALARYIYLGWTKNRKDKITIKIDTDKLILQNMDEITRDLSDAYKSISSDKKIIHFMFSNCEGCMEKVREKYPEYFDEK